MRNPVHNPVHTNVERRSILPWLFVVAPALNVLSAVLSLGA
jgi:hypothetical protein